MGKTLTTKLIVLCVLFFITCVFVYGFNKPAPVRKKPLLSRFFESIDGHTAVRQIPLAPNAVRMLKLDDYVYADYDSGDRKVNLYIGYYYKAAKAYAAHSPLVCYPSQGWKIDTKPVRSTLAVGPHKIYYEEIVTSYGGEKELVMFWYQARLRTNTQVYRNKIDMGYNKLMHNDEQHGFLRVSVPFRDAPYEVVKKTATDFIHSFYPKLVEFVTAGG